MPIWSCDRDLSEDLDILKTYLCTNNEVFRSRLSKVRTRMDSQANIHTYATERITMPHSLVLTIHTFNGKLISNCPYSAVIIAVVKSTVMELDTKDDQTVRVICGVVQC